MTNNRALTMQAVLTATVTLGLLIGTAPATLADDDDRNGSAPKNVSAKRAQAKRDARTVNVSGEELFCGYPVTKSIRLKGDLGSEANPCGAAGGLAIEGRRGITIIDLNGHTIWGSNVGENVGIRIDDSSRVILRGPGKVRGFFDGIRADHGGRHFIIGVTVLDSGNDGIQLRWTSDNRVLFNTVDGAGDRGISLYNVTDNLETRHNLIMGNRIRNANNRLIHIGPGADDNRILTNRLQSTPNEGIQIEDASGNRVHGNTLSGVDTLGIHLLDGATTNRITSNGIAGADSSRGIFADDVSGNEIEKNRVTGHATDLIEGSSTCVNTWAQNTFGTANRPCID